MLSRFHTIPACHGQTDRRTDGIAISISRVSVLTRDKNRYLGMTITLHYILYLLKVFCYIFAIQQVYLYKQMSVHIAGDRCRYVEYLSESLTGCSLQP